MTPAELRPATASSWKDYIQGVESRRLGDEANRVLWIDQVPGRRQRVRSGMIVVSAMNGKPLKAVPHGLIHDWIGAIFIPGVSVHDVIAMLQDYDRYAGYYGPTVRCAKLLDRNGSRDSFRVRYVRKAFFVTVVLDVDYDAEYCRLDEHRWYSVARSTSIREIHTYDEPDESNLPADYGSGYLWRAFSILKLDEGDGGVYVEQESIVLSRKIPVSLRWLIEPFVERLSRELVTGWLRQTREAVLSRALQTH